MDRQKLLEFNPYLQHKFNLNAQESSSFSSYIMERGRTLNLDIFQGRADQSFVGALKIAIDKLPKSKFEKTFRHDMFSKNQIDAAIYFFSKHVGEIVQFKFFLSTSRLKEFAGKNRYNFVTRILPCTQTKSIDVSLIRSDAGIPNSEQEILFNIDSCFKVVKTNKQKPQIVLQEMECTNNPVAVPFF